ncbi:MAG: oligosaccharide flippase family protein [Candidatus Xenobiia bacterium LiM19]
MERKKGQRQRQKGQRQKGQRQKGQRQMAGDEKTPTILRSTLYGYGAGVIYLLTGLFSNIVISRCLGAEALGQYYFIIALNSLLTNLISGGIGLAHSTFLARKEHTLSEMNSVSLFFSIVLGGGAIALFYILRALMPSLFASTSTIYLQWAVLVLPLSLFYRYWNSIMIGLDRIDRLSTVLSLSSIIWNLLIVGAVFIKTGMEGLFIAWMLNFLIGTAMMMRATPGERLRYHHKPQLFKKAFLFGFKGNLGEIATELWKKVDVFLIYYFCGVEKVGYYSVALTLIEKFNQITAPVRIAITPKVASHSMHDATVLVEKASRQILWSTVVVALFLLLVSRMMITVFYGVSFLPSLDPFRILLIGAAVSSVATVLSIFFIGQLKRPELLSIMAWLNVGINVILCLIFIPSRGLIGAALSTAVTSVLGTFIAVVVYGRLTERPVRDLLLLRSSDLQPLLRLIPRRAVRE